MPDSPENNAKSIVYATLITGLFCVLIFAYWYLRGDNCTRPVVYTIGTVDERFSLGRDEVLRALYKAEEVWEEPTFINLLDYGSDADVVVNFLFDDRQENTLSEKQEREQLAGLKNKVDKQNNQYEELKVELEHIQRQYSARRDGYESRLNRFTLERESFDGTEAMANRLNAERDYLEAMRKDLESFRLEVNAAVDRLNGVAVQGQGLVGTYNQNVESYNGQFSGGRSFDQGEYVSDGTINIYQYDNFDDLVLVLGHEFGHALDVGHVSDPRALMHYQLLEQETTNPRLRDADIRGLGQVCSSVVGL